MKGAIYIKIIIIIIKWRDKANGPLAPTLLWFDPKESQNLFSMEHPTNPNLAFAVGQQWKYVRTSVRPLGLIKKLQKWTRIKKNLATAYIIIMLLLRTIQCHRACDCREVSNRWYLMQREDLLRLRSSRSYWNIGRRLRVLSICSGLWWPFLLHASWHPSHLGRPCPSLQEVWKSSVKLLGTSVEWHRDVLKFKLENTWKSIDWNFIWNNGPLQWRGLVHGHTLDRQLGVHNTCPWNCRAGDKQTPGSGSPGDELVTGLTGPWVCSVNNNHTDGKQT